ncbi:TULIP family P47-like protein [Clostridium sp. Marseille-Q2269]|uniref:TULIP family P47-like protein n=1 Tax=Clostridium sp. Marseille-Q2269 TaxID=2942205 RepID=UPI0020730838|nr:TULIP family P47-like protein [Clostridium sp. Marseille-Q2269]
MNNVNNVQFDLFGWDTVQGISFSEVNRAIETLGSTPKDFDYKFYKNNDPKTNDLRRSINGEWSPWKLTLSGDGKILSLQCPIKSGSFYMKTVDGGINLDFANGDYVNIEVRLEYINSSQITHQDPTSKPNTGQQKDLIVKNTSDDQHVNAVSITGYNFSSFTDENSYGDSLIAKSTCKGSFESWFNNKENLEKFKHVFATISVNTTANKGQFQWLKPTDVSYAVSTAEDLDKSIFGILCMTENRTASQYHEIDHRLLENINGNSAFGIQSDRFLEKWILPGLLAMLPGTTPDDYELDGLSYTNKNQIRWGTFKNEDGDTVPATIDSKKLMLGLYGNNIRFDVVDLRWEARDGITVHVNYTESYKLELKSGIDKNGKPYKNIVTAKPVYDKPVLTMSYTVSDALKYKELFTSIGVAIVGAIVGGAIGGLADGIGAAVSKSIGEVAGAGERATVELTEFVTPEAISIGERTAIDQGLEGEITAIDDLIEQGATSTEMLNAIATKPTSFWQRLVNNKWKTLGSIIGGVVGAAAGSTWQIIDSLAQENFSDLPTLDEFTANCVETVKWPDNSGFELQSVSLSDGGFRLGGKLTKTSE